MSRIAMYARVSTKKQDTDMQWADLRKWPSPGDEITEFEDIMSSTFESRPSLDKMMSQVRASKFDVLLVWKFDRIFRSARHLQNSLHELNTLGVRFVSVRESMDTSTPMGRAMFGMLGVLSELERDVIAERVRAGVKRAQAEGTRSGKPFGRPRATFDGPMALRLLADGKTQAEVATACRVSVSCLQKWLRKNR